MTSTCDTCKYVSFILYTAYSILIFLFYYDNDQIEKQTFSKQYLLHCDYRLVNILIAF